jgi:hypothetical protein
VVDRYRRLRGFHRQAGFEDEAQWLDKRLRHLAPPRQLGFLTTRLEGRD